MKHILCILCAISITSCYTDDTCNKNITLGPAHNYEVPDARLDTIVYQTGTSNDNKT